jgi:hypothetical protein
MDHNDDLTARTTEVMRRFNDVFQKHDPSCLPDLVGEDCIIENTAPAPEGARLVGSAACIANWANIATAPGTHFDLEETFAVADRGIIRWRFHAADGHSMRGVNLMRVRDGRIVEAMGYVKGA